MNKDLRGLRVLNTRPKESNQALSRAIEAAKGSVIELPALCIEPLPDGLNNMPSLAMVDEAIFISPTAVHYFCQALQQHAIRWPSTLEVTAIGHATRKALLEQGMKVHQAPLMANSEELLQLPHLQQVKNKTILLIKGVGGLPTIEETLVASGAKVVVIMIYRRSLPTYPSATLHALWQDDAVDIILFTSEQAIHNYMSLFNGQQAQQWLCHKPWLVISDRLAKVAALCGSVSCFTCTHDTIIDALCLYHKGLSHDNRSK